MLNKKKKQKGFTLIELLVVIAIIGILAVVAVPALFSNINKAKVADLKSDYNAYKSASLAYYTDNSSLPTEVKGYDKAVPVSSLKVDNENILAPYLDNIPFKSPFDTDYKMFVNTNGDLVLTTTIPKLVGDEKLASLIEKDSNGTITAVKNGTAYTGEVDMILIGSSMDKTSSK